MHARQDWTEPFTHIACRQAWTGQELNILLHQASDDASANWLLGLEFLGMRDKPSPESGTSSGKKDPLVSLARYSEIGFIIPAAILLGFFLGKLADYWLHTKWLYLVGLLFGAVVGFWQMIRMAVGASKDKDE
jgi:hypothetical protein